MRPVVTAESVRVAERHFFETHPGVDLMSRAASAIADHASNLLGRRCEAKQVLVVVGPGNNGGDGLFAAATMSRQGATVTLLPTAGTMHDAGRRAAERAGCRAVGIDEAMGGLPDCDLLIDAVLGIGGRAGLREPVATLAAEAQALGVPVLSVDLPSGLDADSHEISGASFVADHTITFIAEKTCHVARPAADRCGEVRVVDIGVRVPLPELDQAEVADVARLWPWPSSASDKYSRGVVGLDTGSADYTGAAVLGATGAVHAGAGMVRFAGPGHAADLIRALLPGVVIGSGRVQAWVCGSGWGEADAARFDARLADGVPMVVDADAIALVPGLLGSGRELPSNSLLTPHAGELARLLGVQRAEIEADPALQARTAASRFGVTVLLKGASQYVARPDGETWLAVPGPAWTAQAGSGDTLAGVCGTLLAAGLDAVGAALLGSSLQAITAGRNPGPWPPDTLARKFPETLAWLRLAALAQPS